MRTGLPNGIACLNTALLGRSNQLASNEDGISRPHFTAASYHITWNEFPLFIYFIIFFLNLIDAIYIATNASCPNGSHTSRAFIQQFDKHDVTINCI